MAVRGFERHGLHFPVLDAGPAAGAVVVLLHGFPQSPAAFDDLAPRLHDHGLRTLAPTARGYAASCRPTQRRDYGGAQLAGDVIALLDAAGIDRAHLVGHDWGAAQAWNAAARYPDRIQTLTALSVPHPDALLRSFVRSGQLLRSWYMGMFQLPWLPERLAGRTLRQSLLRSGLPEPYADRYARNLTEPGALTGALNWYRGMPFSPPLGPVAVPTTLVWGERDPFLGRAAAEACEAYVRAPYRFVTLAAGHWLPETRAEAVAEIVIERSESG